MTKRINLLTLLLLAALSLAACGPADEPAAAPPPVTVTTFVAEGHLLPARDLHLSFLARGRVEEVLVRTGQRVEAGQDLVRLGDREQAEAAVTAARLELTLAEQALDQLTRTAGAGHAQAVQDLAAAQRARASAQLAWGRLDLTDIQADIDDARATVLDRQADIDAAVEDLQPYLDLPSDNATRRSYESALRTAQTNYDTAVQALDNLVNGRDTLRAALDAALTAEAEAQRAVENTADGPDVDKLALAQARVDAAGAGLAAAEAALANYTLTAPFDGLVADVNLAAGDMAGPETWAVALFDPSAWFVETSDLSELDVIQVTEGQSVEVTADALPDVIMTGTVERVSLAPKLQGGDVLYTVRIRLEDPDQRLRWGMTVEVTFTQDQ